MRRFTQNISIVGVNSYVTVPLKITKTFGKKGFVAVKIKVNGHPFLANLVPVGGGGAPALSAWRYAKEGHGSGGG